ncbi:MAG: peptide-methionine (S)-S-oxide reductase, partial [Dehalococcoidia bacterium]
SVINFQDLLEIFFKAHDPTTINRQGADMGSQYRSIILYTDNTQKTIADKFIANLNESKVFQHPVITEIKALEAFYPAETYHQEYYQRNTEQPYCRAVIEPKLAKLFKA